MSDPREIMARMIDRIAERESEPLTEAQREIVIEIAIAMRIVEQMVHGGSNRLAASRLLDVDESAASVLLTIVSAGACGKASRRLGRRLTREEMHAMGDGVMAGIEMAVAAARVDR